MTVEQEVIMPQPDHEGTYHSRGTVYSWGRTARKLTEPAFKQVLRGATQDIIAVDLCSSYPLYREIMIGQHKQRRAAQAKKAVALFANAALYSGVENAPAGLDAKDLAALRGVFRNEDITRGLFEGAVLSSGGGGDMRTSKTAPSKRPLVISSLRNTPLKAAKSFASSPAGAFSTPE